MRWFERQTAEMQNRKDEVHLSPSDMEKLKQNKTVQEAEKLSKKIVSPSSVYREHFMDKFTEVQ